MLGRYLCSNKINFFKKTTSITIEDQRMKGSCFDHLHVCWTAEMNLTREFDVLKNLSHCSTLRQQREVCPPIASDPHGYLYPHTHPHTTIQPQIVSPRSTIHHTKMTFPGGGLFQSLKSLFWKLEQRLGEGACLLHII